MREIIEKRDKRAYIVSLIVSLITILGSIVMINLRNLVFVGIYFYYLGIVMLCVMSFAGIGSAIMLIDPRGVIMRDGEKIIFLHGIRKTEANLSDVIMIKRIESTQIKGELMKSALLVTLRAGEEEKLLRICDLADSGAALERLATIVSEYNDAAKTEESFTQ